MGKGTPKNLRCAFRVSVPVAAVAFAGLVLGAGPAVNEEQSERRAEAPGPPPGVDARMLLDLELLRDLDLLKELESLRRLEGLRRPADPAGSAEKKSP